MCVILLVYWRNDSHGVEAVTTFADDIICYDNKH